MKKIIGAILLAAGLTITVACEVPEDDDNTTAADRAEVNNKPAKADKAKKKAKKDEAPKESVSQENARKSAESYLDLSPFSRSGLIEQLEFEGYSTNDATYGVDAQKANWKNQAAAKAEEYLDMSSFSRSGLIEQLEFEGFSREQAEHGVTQVGL